MKRRQFFKAAAATAGGVLASKIASAQAPWKPSRPVAFVVGATPGGSLDLTARLIQRVWDQQHTIGQPVIVVNKAGAGQGLAWDYMRDKGAQGHAIALGGPNLLSNAITGVHPIGPKDVRTIAMLLDDYIGIVVRPDSPLTSMRDAVDRLRKDPGAGRLRALAVSSAKRAPMLPDMPTLLESGVKAEINGWYSLMGPANMPAPIVAMLNAQVNRMLGQPEFLEKLAALGASPFGGTPQDVVSLVRSDMAKYARAIKESGAKAE